MTHYQLSNINKSYNASKFYTLHSDIKTLILTAIESACNVSIISRADWNATPPNDHDALYTPVTVVILHHTDRQHCTTKAECITELQDMQRFHMNNQSRVLLLM